MRKRRGQSRPTGRWLRSKKQERSWRRWPLIFRPIRKLGLKRLHDARVRLKRIRYVAELAEESAEQKNFIRELKAVQDALGEWHDWQELTRTAEKRFSDRVNCALLREIRSLLAARHSTAVSAIDKVFLALGPARKPPRPDQSVRAFTRYA